jgi:hypothetical protein
LLTLTCVVVEVVAVVIGRVTSSVRRVVDGGGTMGTCVEGVRVDTSLRTEHVTDPSPAQTGMGTSWGENFAPVPVPY